LLISNLHPELERLVCRMWRLFSGKINQIMVFLYGSIVVGDVQRWPILFHSIGDWCMEVAVRWHESTNVLTRECPECTSAYDCKARARLGIWRVRRRMLEEDLEHSNTRIGAAVPHEIPERQNPPGLCARQGMQDGKKFQTGLEALIKWVQNQQFIEFHMTYGMS